MASKSKKETPALGAQTQEVKTEWLLHLYESQVAIQSAYSEIIWKRFSWFIAIQGALLSLYITQRKIIEAAKIDLLWIGTFALVLCGLNILIGALDVRSHRRIKDRRQRTLKAILKRMPEVDGKEDDHLFPSLARLIKRPIIKEIFHQTNYLWITPVLIAGIWLVLIFLSGMNLV